MDEFFNLCGSFNIRFDRINARCGGMIGAMLILISLIFPYQTPMQDVTSGDGIFPLLQKIGRMV